MGMSTIEDRCPSPNSKEEVCCPILSYYHNTVMLLQPNHQDPWEGKYKVNIFNMQKKLIQSHN